MHLIVRVTMFHRLMIILYSEKKLIYKLTEDIRCLKNALVSGESGTVADKLADVILTLPYLKYTMLWDEKLEIKCKGEPDYNSSSNALLSLIALMAEYNSSSVIRESLKYTARNFCHSLFSIYMNNHITYDEMEKRIERKMRTALRSSFRELRLLLKENGFLINAAAVMTAVPLTLCYLCAVTAGYLYLIFRLVTSGLTGFLSTIASGLPDLAWILIFIISGTIFLILLVLPFAYMKEKLYLNLKRSRRRIAAREKDAADAAMSKEPGRI